MVNRVIILIDEDRRGGIDFSELGTMVSEISELYQLVKESDYDLLLVGDRRGDMTHGIAMKLHRYNAMMDIWRLGSDVGSDAGESIYDGCLDLSLGQSGLRKKIERILQDKARLADYGIVARSAKMRTVGQTIARIAPTGISVLVVGPSGSGKELVARALHKQSDRRDKPIVAINCGALAEGVLESELFGHEKGAFTGSVARREGLFHKADGGTIFLDEIGETRAEMQVKLLRVLEDGTYYPVGSSTPRRANVRVVAATNRDLSEAIAEKTFREDLYFRISVVKIVLPPLLERRRDIQPLVHFFWRDQRGLSYSDAAMEMLMKYDWPGNVRQLKNFASRMAAMKPQGRVDEDDVQRFIAEQHVSVTHLPVSTGRTVEEAGQELIYRAILQLGNEIRMLRDLITSHIPSEPAASFEEPSVEVGKSRSIEDMERKMIEKALRETGGNRKEAARTLGIGERTLYRKLNKYNLN